MGLGGRTLGLGILHPVLLFSEGRGRGRGHHLARKWGADARSPTIQGLGVAACLSFLKPLVTGADRPQGACGVSVAPCGGQAPLSICLSVWVHPSPQKEAQTCSHSQFLPPEGSGQPERPGGDPTVQAAASAGGQNWEASLSLGPRVPWAGGLRKPLAGGGQRPSPAGRSEGAAA